MGARWVVPMHHASRRKLTAGRVAGGAGAARATLTHPPPSPSLQPHTPSSPFTSALVRAPRCPPPSLSRPSRPPRPLHAAARLDSPIDTAHLVREQQKRTFGASGRLPRPRTPMCRDAPRPLPPRQAAPGSSWDAHFARSSPAGMPAACMPSSQSAPRRGTCTCAAERGVKAEAEGRVLSHAKIIINGSNRRANGVRNW